ncbi:thiolase family protein [Brevibacillus sp. SYSU BS000544]|uniref:thiolase family protein n=1 Tax=Brevibacillus sp. SYSU BS000544 TaxID=3416443 RepID=UPI003CE47FD5
MVKPNPVVVYAKRTPIGKMGGVFRNAEPEDLIAPLIKDAVSQCRLDANQIDEVILGNVVGPGGNLARLAALTAGLPLHVPGVTVDRQCGAGLEAIILACRMVQAGAGDIYLAGGVESTSRAPWKMEKPSNLYAKPPRLFGRARFSPDDIGDPEMGEAAENVAEQFQITRADQDEWALRSHQKAVQAMQGGTFAKLILPIDTLQGMVDQDECPRPDTNMDKLAALRPVFRQGGTVTAGNACPINDGACLTVIMSEQKARQLGITPLLRFVDSVSMGIDPLILGAGPIPAVTRLLDKTGVTTEELTRIEFNEAFASQVLACIRELRLPIDRVNPDGGAIALGHPYGASGAVLVTHLAHGMAASSVDGANSAYGLATLGIGGGLGLAALFERVND